jgi:ribonucleoside-diphosphate reductase alpha chain
LVSGRYDRGGVLGFSPAAGGAAPRRAAAAPANVDLAGMAASAPVSAPAGAATAPQAEAPKAPEPPANVGSSTELLEVVLGTSADAPLCFTCGTKMRPAGSCYVCEGCGSTSGCS